MDDSKLFGMSLRGAICIILTLTVCFMSGLDRIIKEPLYSAFLLALGFYFGQKNPNSKLPDNSTTDTTTVSTITTQPAEEKK